MTMKPHDFWQQIYAEGSVAPGPRTGPQTGQDAFAAPLPDGRAVMLPIRHLPGGGGVASLILNQASFAVLDALADALAERLLRHLPEVIVAVPTLGLPLAEAVARRLGHTRIVPLGTSRKFWYDAALSQPLRSITSPDHIRRIYLDPRMLPLLQGQRVAVVDDVISTGASMRSVLDLLALAGVAPVAIGAAMLQSRRWAGTLGAAPVLGAIETPLLRETPDGWIATDD